MQDKKMPISYNILNFQSIVADVNKRSQLLSDFRNLMEKRIGIQKQYSERLNSLAYLSSEAKNIYNSKSGSEQFFNSFLITLKNQANNANNYMQKLKEDILQLVDKRNVESSKETKKLIVLGKSLIKDYEGQRKSFSKVQGKYIQKCEDLKKMIQNYLIGILGELSFDKKNESYLKINEESQKQYSELSKWYNKNNVKFNEYAQTYIAKLKETIKKISKIELQKAETIKQSYMNFQLQRSTYGASMVKQNNKLLAQIHILSQQNPDLIFPQNQQRQKYALYSKKLDPCGYLVKLFTSLKSQKTESLIIYGQSEEHRNNLKASFSERAVSNIMEEEKSRIFQISELFHFAFDEMKEFNEERSQRLKKLMNEDAESRKDFILCLQKFRRNNQFEMKQNSLPKITQVLHSLLDICLKEKDTYNSKLLMVLSFTYYIKKGESQKYLAQFIKEHKIWKDKQWWESALYESVYEEVQIKSKKSEQIVINIWDIKGSGMKQSQNEYESTFQTIVFNQLIYYIHNMKLLDLPAKMMSWLQKKFVKTFSLSKKMIVDLQKCMKGEQMVEEDETFSFSDNSGDSGSNKKIM